jgi:hypothetical protein
MPEGIEDNYVDEMFLKGLVHKSIHILINLILDSFPDLHYPTMIRETFEIVHVLNTLVQFLVTNLLFKTFIGEFQVFGPWKL